MWINTETIVSFQMPEEAEAAKKFEQQHPNWEKAETSGWLNFRIEKTYEMRTKEVEDT